MTLERARVVALTTKKMGAATTRELVTLQPNLKLEDEAAKKEGLTTVALGLAAETGKRTPLMRTFGLPLNERTVVKKFDGTTTPRVLVEMTCDFDIRRGALCGVVGEVHASPPKMK